MIHKYPTILRPFQNLAESKFGLSWLFVASFAQRAFFQFDPIRLGWRWICPEGSRQTPPIKGLEPVSCRVWVHKIASFEGAGCLGWVHLNPKPELRSLGGFPSTRKIPTFGKSSQYILSFWEGFSAHRNFSNIPNYGGLWQPGEGWNGSGLFSLHVWEAVFASLMGGRVYKWLGPIITYWSGKNTDRSSLVYYWSANLAYLTYKQEVL